MKLLIKFNEHIQKVEEFLLAGSVIGALAILVANVFCRQLFGFSITWTEEICSILSVYMGFVGLTYAARVGRHIVMTALYDVMTIKGKRCFTLISSSATAICLFIFAYFAFVYIQTLYVSARCTSILLIPLWIPYSIVPLGFFFGAIQYLIIFYTNVREKTNVTTKVTAYHGDDIEAIDLSDLSAGGEKV